MSFLSTLANRSRYLSVCGPGTCPQNWRVMSEQILHHNKSQGTHSLEMLIEEISLERVSCQIHPESSGLNPFSLLDYDAFKVQLGKQITTVRSCQENILQGMGHIGFRDRKGTLRNTELM